MEGLRARSSVAQGIKILLLGVALLWGLELIDLLVFRGSLDRFGIRPRDLGGLDGVLFAPLLHGGLAHLAANTVPLFVLGFFTLLRGLGSFALVTGIVWLVGGLGTWLTGGANTLHIGSSILVFGYLGYLLARAYYERSFSALAVALIVGVLYGGAIWGVLPLQEGVSWQGHLFGFLGGVLAARFGRDARAFA